jgi:DNA polymerase I
MPERPVLHLVDGSGYIYRAYYAIRPLSTRDGTPTNAVLGFAKMLIKLIKDEHPVRLGLAFDRREPTFRHQLYTEYKANREVQPEDLAPQFALIHELVLAMDIPILTAPGYEADDVLASLARQAIAAGFDVVVVSGDKDLMQLVGPHLSLFDPMKDKHYGASEVVERFGVPPAHVADLLALAGDSSDNIPGVPKVGEKSAAKLVGEFGDLEAVIAGLGEAGRKLKAYESSVLENAALARLSKRLTLLAADAPVQLDVESLRYSAPRPEKLTPFLRRIEAIGLIRELNLEQAEGAEAVAQAPETAAATEPAAGAAQEVGTQLLLLPAAPKLEVVAIDRSRYRTLFDRDELARFLERARASGELSVDLETTSLDPNRADVVGIALCIRDEPPVYVPVAHRYLGAPRQMGRGEALALLAPVLADERVRKVGQNLKYDIVTLMRAGVAVSGVADDSMIAAYVLDPSRASFSLDNLARELLGHEGISYREVTGSGRQQICFEEVDVERATEYAAEDADLAFRVCHILRQRIEEAGLTNLYREIELPLVPVLAAMERTGIRVDPARLRHLGEEFTSRLAEIEARAHAIIGSPVNLASPRQLAELFFEKLGYPVVRKTKTGYSTDQEVLEVLARDYELPRVILEHRLLAKLKSTYVDMLGRMVNPETGRVHTSYNQTGTATGRLSSSDPNLQNIPVRSEDGRRIRAAFVAQPGSVLISADYSQIELRVMAHLSGDPHFIEAFERGEDIHARTAREIITGGLEVDAEARRRAKAINFGILYGLSEYGLSRQLDIPRGEAATYIAAYFGRYPRIREFLDHTIAEATERGYVTTITGRRRFLPELKSQNRAVRQGAERIAMNTPIQGSAADLIKLAMLRVAGAITQRGLRTRMLLQVHDELVLEAPIDEREEAADLVREEMTGVLQLAVPLEVDVGVGDDWAAAH